MRNHTLLFSCLFLLTLPLFGGCLNIKNRPLTWNPEEQEQRMAELREPGEQKIAQLLETAERGDAEAQYHLGFYYLYGMRPEDSTEENDIEGVKWLRKAAEQGVGLTVLGLCYNKGMGVPEDKEEAVRWYRKAAEQGEPNGIYLLAWSYFRGEGVPEDKTEGIRLYRIAAEQDDGGAQYELGECYYNGDGVPQDKTEAIKWYKKAGVNRTGLIRYNVNGDVGLIRCYFNGEYVPDEEELEGWLHTLRWQIEFANENKNAKVAKDQDQDKNKEYWQEQASVAAELLRELEKRKKTEIASSGA